VILIKRAIGALWETVFVEGVFHISCRYSANRPPIYHVLSGDRDPFIEIRLSQLEDSIAFHHRVTFSADSPPLHPIRGVKCSVT
jgi:hypothetical protein